MNNSTETFKVGIAGVGVVGGALLKSLQNRTFLTVFPYDKYKNIGKQEDLLNTKFTFLCLPTLYSNELQQYDKTSIYDVCQYLSYSNYKGVVVIKSTVEPETTQHLYKQFDNLNLCHNPEFLTARTAYEDLENQDHVVLGRHEKCNLSKYEDLKRFYKLSYPNAEISECTSTESEMMKISVNNYYSVKIQFFNELYQLCQRNNSNYENVRNLMLKNNWIHKMHTDVPGHDGELSYSGMCFPKDTNALLQYMKRLNSPHNVLQGTVEERNTMRTDQIYDI